MGLGALGSMLGLPKRVVWELVSKDDGTKITGDFQPESLTESIAGNWAETSTLGMEHPILQFVRGGMETISFSATCHAYSQGLLGTQALVPDAGKIEDKVNAIRNLPRIDSDIGRPHVYDFTVGATFQQQVVVSSVGGISYSRFRDSAGGSMRTVRFQIELLRYVTLKKGTSTNESLIVHARDADSYEGIAKRVYGNALLGEVLRRRNPDKRVLVHGDQIHVPPRKIMASELDLNPASTVLKDDEKRKALKEAYLSKRGKSKVSHIVLEDM